MNLKTILKGKDIFGYYIALNFNKEGQHHKTLIGGIFTVTLYMFMVYYINRITRKMVFFEDDNIFVSTTFEAGEEILWADTHIVQYHALNKIGEGYAEPLFYD
jgi:hypothetical protein